LSAADRQGEPAAAQLAHGKTPSSAVPKDVLLIAYAYPPDNFSGAARPHRFAKYLERLGHNVQVVAAQHEKGVSHVGNVHRAEGDFDQNIRSLPWYFEKVVRNLFCPHDEGWRWALRAARASEELFAGKRPVIVSTAPPMTVHLAAARVKAKHGWPWIADFRDPLAGNAYRTNAIAKRMDPYLEKLIFRRADRLIANTDAVADIWRRRYPHYAHKVHLIWNGFDPEVSLDALPPPAGPRLIRHVGSVYGDRYPQPLLAAFQSMFDRGLLRADDLSIELVGQLGAPAGVTIPQAPWLRLTPQVSRAEADRLTASAHYLLLLDVTQASQSLQVPAKLFDYIRVGRPVLTVTLPGSPAERILKQAGIPSVFLYPTDSQETLVAKITEFTALPPVSTPYSLWFSDSFDGARQAAALSALIQGLG